MRDDPLTWKKIAPYLDQALDLEPGARTAWLDELETTQAEVARGLRKLLREYEALNAEGFLEGSPLPLTRLDTFVDALEKMLHRRDGVESAHWLKNLPDFAQTPALERRATDVSPGEVLGPYRLLREIGHGGMSSVWLAERCDGQFTREVALKLPFEGPLRAQMAERFKRERDILATLTHPNIARLYDAGIDARGRSYLAMEYVSGTTLTRYCDAGRLSIRERLKLFLQVLAAVEFAHTHLVLHRDLKPSNILVAGQGRVVLLDFGIAKLLSPESVAESPPTEMSGRLLTLDYASPEQIAGRALGTTSDVYSLGVVLYELLAGGRPYGAQQKTRRELEDAILTQDAPRLSELVLTEEAAAARHMTPRKLAQALKGDLDTIVLKALKKAPQERYQSIEAFARDIGNYLGNLPVSARPDSAWYRTRRFVTRHRWQVTAAAVTVLAIAAGGATAVWQAQAAALQRDRALALASRNRAINDFMEMLIVESAASERPITVNEMLARSEKLALSDTRDSGENRAAILETIAALHLSAFGDVGKSTQLLEHALALLADSRDGALRSRLVCQHAVNMALMGEGAAAISTLNREIGTLQADPQTASECLGNLAQIATELHDVDGALRYAELALERFHQAATNVPADEAVFLELMAFALHLKGDNGKANDFYELALSKYTEAGRERSLNALAMMNNWATVKAGAGVPKHALELYEQFQRIALELDPEGRPHASLMLNRARALESIGRYAQAKDAYEQGYQLAIQSKIVGTQALCLLGLASIAQQSRDSVAVARFLDQATQLVGPEPADAAVLNRRALIRGRLDLAAGRLDAARAQFTWLLDRKIKNSFGNGAALGMAEIELLAGATAAAEAAARAGLDMATSLQGGVPYSNLTGLCWLTLGRILQARGQVEPARRAFQSAVMHLSNTVDADHPALMQARQSADGPG